MGIVAALIALVAIPLTAQGGPLTMLRMLFVLQQQVDAIQRRQDGTGDLRMRLNIDTAYESSPGVVFVNGWVFACEDPDARVVVVVDGVQSVQSGPGSVYRYLRSDVNAAYEGFCFVPMHVGVTSLVDMAVFQPGWIGNHQHTIKLRLYDSTGRMAESNTVTVTTQ